MKLSAKYLFSGILIGLVLLMAFLASFPDGKLHITFCNVGQGDAAYIRFPNNSDMLIDGGPDDKVLSCLGRYMPFYDRTIDMVVLSYPQKDHLQGLISVVQRYNIQYFVIGVEGNETEGYRKLIDNISKKNIVVKNLYQGDELRMGEVKVALLWPTRQFVAANVPTEELNNGAKLGLATKTDLSSFSYFMNIQYGKFSALFTGDGDNKIQPEILRTVDLPKVDVLKVPHHGSAASLMPEFLDKIQPNMAILSVGKNGYGYPSIEALNLLREKGTKLKRTDKDGDVEVVSDGRGWVVN